ncbi:hypothetical protein ACX83S_32250, partial [Burkholderia pseudomallei]
MTRNTGRPPMFFNGKYDRCVDGSTATTWAWAASRPSSIFRTPLASTRNLDMTPALTCLISSGHFNLGERPRLLQLNNTA